MDREALFDNYYPFVAYYRVRRTPTSTHANPNYPNDDPNTYINNADHEEEGGGEEEDYLMRFESLMSNVARASQDVSKFILSRYSSTNTSQVSAGLDDGHDHDPSQMQAIEDEEEEKKEDEGWWQYFSFRTYPTSLLWFILQLSWRLMLSLTVALTVFYLATRPPVPDVSIKMAGLGRFELGEGVDYHGVGTKFLTCNSTLELLIDNKSKMFGLHIHPPLLEMSFSRLPLAFSQGRKLFAPSGRSSKFGFNVGTKGKPMYGAGASMEDKLNSRAGLGLVVRISFGSNYRVVGDLVRPKFHHLARCVLLIHKKARASRYDYTTNCKMVSY